MTKLKLFLPSIVVIVMCSLALLFSPVHGASPAGEVTLTQAEVVELKSNYNEVLNIMNSQLTTIEELQQQLNVAQMSTNESKQQLLIALRLLDEQKKELQQAKNSLQEQEKMLSEQRLSLAKAEVYLNEQKNEIAKMKAKQRNSTLLNIAMGLGLVYVAVK